MRKLVIVKKKLVLLFAIAVFLLPANGLVARADEVIATVEGTIQSGTTADILKLSTKEGDMEIKLDGATDASACKILLPDTKIKVSVSHGSDGYLHAVKITGGEQAPVVSVDTSSTSTVTGTIGEKTKGDLLYVNTAQGEMQIKLDTTTNMSGCTVLVADKSYNITCARGSDAYMHAVSISDASSGVSTSAGTSSGLTPAPASAVNESTTSVSGKVADGTKENLLYLETDGGEMEIVIDSSTDSRGGMVLTPGNKLTVSVYRGSDAYMHAAVITGKKDSTQSVEIDTSSPASVTGTVGSKSTENLLYLDTPQGQMELKLDAVKSVSNCKVLVSGKKFTVTCARGSDAYMHAIDITGA